MGGACLSFVKGNHDSEEIIVISSDIFPLDGSMDGIIEIWVVVFFVSFVEDFVFSGSKPR